MPLGYALLESNAMAKLLLQNCYGDFAIGVQAMRKAWLSVMGKKLKLLAVLTACIFAAGILGGCASDAAVKSYIQALLDASYKNDQTAFVEMNLGTAEEAQALYEQGIDNGVSVFCGKIGASEEYREEFRSTYVNLLSKVRYNVEEAKKQKDGSYVVVLSYEKMKVFKPAQEKYQKNSTAMIEKWKKSSDKMPSEEDMKREVTLEFKRIMDEVLENVQYEAPASISIKIEIKDNVYTPNADDVAKLEAALFDGT